MATTTATAIELTENSNGGRNLPDFTVGGLAPSISNTEDVLVQPLDDDAQPSKLSRGRSTAIIVTVAGVNFLNVCGSGILTVALPQMAKDLRIPRELLLW